MNQDRLSYATWSGFSPVKAKDVNEGGNRYMSPDRISEMADRLKLSARFYLRIFRNKEEEARKSPGRHGGGRGTGV